MDELSLFQIKKQLLPTLPLDLNKILINKFKDSLFFQENGSSFMKDSYNNYRLVIDYPVLEKLDSLDSGTDSIYCCVLAYIVDHRFFNYGPNKAKEAVELICDINGSIHKTVQWGVAASRKSKGKKLGELVVYSIEDDIEEISKKCTFVFCAIDAPKDFIQKIEDCLKIKQKDKNGLNTIS